MSINLTGSMYILMPHMNMWVYHQAHDVPELTPKMKGGEDINKEEENTKHKTLN